MRGGQTASFAPEYLARITAVAVFAALAAPACASPEEPSCEIPSGLPVFPGAEGFGSTTPAGRGGAVIEVTSLADSGPGSLRAAVEAVGPRIVVFRVGGTITLTSHLEIHEPFLTVAGQTAVGDGILLNGYGVVIFTHDILLQHLRVRPGNFSDVTPENNDAIAILGAGAGAGEDAYNVVLDHVSASWGEDEVVSTLFGAHDLTISWSMIAEGLDQSRHEKGSHSAGLLLGDHTTCASVHHTLLAHNAFRNPLISVGGRHDIVNNLIYDWRDTATEIVPLDTVLQANLVGNCYRPGPSSNRDMREIIRLTGHPARYVADGSELLTTAGALELFVEGNLSPHRPDATGDEWAVVGTGWDNVIAPEDFRAKARHAAAPIQTKPAAEACEDVLNLAGATLPRRDSIDERVVSETRAETGGILDSPDTVGGFPNMASGEPPIDSDHDGMPDDWELAQGLDPMNAADGAGDIDADGYTNVEEYLHSLLVSP